MLYKDVVGNKEEIVMLKEETIEMIQIFENNEWAI